MIVGQYRDTADSKPSELVVHYVDPSDGKPWCRTGARLRALVAWEGSKRDVTCRRCPR